MRFAGVVVGVLALVVLGAGTAGATTTSTGGGVVETVRAPAKLAYGDGCTKVPDSYLGANFRPACDKHDNCYSSDSSTDRLDCDKRLAVNLVKACKAEFGKYNPLRYSCIDMAGKYYLGVRAFGESHYDGTGDPS
ncbi:phospholipase A2 [Actinophytocola sp.]|uniref:phospholipase A2 n=1 Tax=Actinophytocola sp. TaxID=1872138 RepID=UPI003D6A9125